MSLFDCQRTSIWNFKFETSYSISTKRRNFNPQNEAGIRCRFSTSGCRSFKSSSSDERCDFKSDSEIDRNRKVGGGEGIRTPDPRVANAVLCQLSYAPDKTSNLKSEISKSRRLVAGAGFEPATFGL